jgi:Flp pilus assembly protein TadG
MTMWNRLTARLRVVRGDERGAVAVQFALLLLPIAILTFGLIDISRISVEKRQLQDALDAATLMAARSNASTDAALAAIGRPALTAELPTTKFTATNSDFTGAADVTIVGTASVGITPIVANLWTKDPLITINARSEVKRSTNDIEVALVLDTTGSMAGQKITDLKAAANELIKIVVKDNQTPFYTKVAIVPYSMGVNVGAYADQVRGPLPGPKTITGATKANPVVITAAGHGFINGDKVSITGVNGMTNLNGKIFTVTEKTTDTFKLSGVDGRNYTSYASGGTVTCDTSTNPGCKNFAFTNANSQDTVYAISTCVTERTGSNAYTDIAPSTTYLGRNYPSPGASNPCPTANEIVPLSSDRTALAAKVNALTAGGSTGGHIGVGWGWYMVSPNFGYLWPSQSRPAAYSKKDLLKVVVLMTDGEYNSAYCKGVISQDSTSGSGGADTHINCNAPNGGAFAQAMALCDAMKLPANGQVIVYTVGFNVVNDQRAKDLVNNCATDAKHVYLPSTGTALKDAFAAIGRDITSVRISQ